MSEAICGIVVALWFVCGLAALAIAIEVDALDGPIESAEVWLALLGPVALFASLGDAVRIASRQRAK